MESRWRTLFFLIIGFLFTTRYNLVAQDTTSYFRLNVGGTIYFQQEEKSSNYFLYPTPEIDVFYKIRYFKTLSVFTGVHYTYSYSHYDLGYKSEWRRKAHELAFPVFIEQNIGNYISINGGAAIGYLIKGKEEYRNNIPAHPKWEDVTIQTDYDESSRFYIELYLDPKLKYDLDSNNTVSISPTISYKMKDNWMNEIRPKTMFGISFQYSFRF